MHPIAQVFAVILSAVAAGGVYLVVMPALVGTQANVTVQTVQTLAAILKDAERQGIGSADRDDVDEIAYLLTGWTQDGDAVSTSSTGSLLDSPSGLNTISLTDQGTNNGFHMLVEDSEVCIRALTTLASRASSQYLLHPRSCEGAGPSITGVAGYTSGGGGAMTTANVNAAFAQDQATGATRTISIAML